MKRVRIVALAAAMILLCYGCIGYGEWTRSPSTVTTAATMATTAATTAMTTVTVRPTTTTQGYRDRVYVTPYGKKYHRRASCAGENATPTERETAALYFEPCKKCAGG